MKDDFRLVIFDVEGTLARTKSGETFRKAPDDWQLYPDVQERLEFLKGRGVKIAVASNQGGVAYGYLDAKRMGEELGALCDLIGADASAWCFHHPDGHVVPWAGPCECRKPKGGMLRQIMREIGVGPEETLMVGDRPEDKGAAIHAGCHFMLSADYFERELPLDLVKG